MNPHGFVPPQTLQCSRKTVVPKRLRFIQDDFRSVAKTINRSGNSRNDDIRLANFQIPLIQRRVGNLHNSESASCRHGLCPHLSQKKTWLDCRAGSGTSLGLRVTPRGWCRPPGSAISVPWCILGSMGPSRHRGLPITNFCSRLAPLAATLQTCTIGISQASLAAVLKTIRVQRQTFTDWPWCPGHLACWLAKPSKHELLRGISTPAETLKAPGDEVLLSGLAT